MKSAGKIVPIVMILIITTLLLLNFTGQINARAGGPLPTPDEPIAYCHYSVQTWMNGLREDPESQENVNETHIRTSDETWIMGFPLRESEDDDLTLAQPIYFDTSLHAQGWFQVTFEVGLGTAEPSDVIIRLITTDSGSMEVIGEDSAPEYVENAESFKFEMALSKNKVSSLTLQITWTAHPGTTSFIIDTNGGSFVTLPLVSDSDGDGVADNIDAFPSDPAASTDSDGDGYPDEWNEGYDEEDSTTGLKIDEFPDDATRWKEEDKEDNGTPGFESLSLFVGVIVAIMILGRRKKRNNP